VAPVAIASALSGELRRVQRGLKEAPAVTFVTNRDDGAGNAFAEVTRAAVEALLRVWRHEEEHDVRRPAPVRGGAEPGGALRQPRGRQPRVHDRLTLTLANRVRPWTR